jgi:hypothetical protein
MVRRSHNLEIEVAFMCMTKTEEQKIGQEKKHTSEVQLQKSAHLKRKRPGHLGTPSRVGPQ